MNNVIDNAIKTTKEVLETARNNKQVVYVSVSGGGR